MQSAVTCSAYCNPECKYSWHFNALDGREVSATSNLMLNGIRKEEHGKYYCRISNGIKPDKNETLDITVYCEY